MWCSRAGTLLPSLCSSVARQARPLPSAAVSAPALTPCRSLTVSSVKRALRYRQMPVMPTKANELKGELFCGIMWWWVLWHLWTEPGHIIGEFPQVDPSKWTDEQLGIPPDSYGPAPRIQY